MSPELATLLDAVDPFTNVVIAPLFDARRLEELRAIPDVKDELVAVVNDESAPLARRIAAAQALLEGGWGASLAAEQSAAVASVLAAAIAHDTLHNRWGLPGYTVGPVGTLLLSLPPASVEQALRPLLTDDRELVIDGSEEATIARAARYRVADLAGYLIAVRRGLSWRDDLDPTVRDGEIERVRAALSGPPP